MSVGGKRLGPVASRISLVGVTGVCGMPEAVETKWPVLGRHERAAEWLRIWIDLGRAPRTIDAYARGLAEYLQVCEREGIDPLAATRAQVAVFVRELTSRPSRRGANVVALDSGCGAGERDPAAAAGAGSAVLRLPGRGGRAGVESCWPGPLYAWPAVGWAGERAGAADGEAAVDPERGRMAATAGGVRRASRSATG